MKAFVAILSLIPSEIREKIIEKVSWNCYFNAPLCCEGIKEYKSDVTIPMSCYEYLARLGSARKEKEEGSEFIRIKKTRAVRVFKEIVSQCLSKKAEEAEQELDQNEVASALGTNGPKLLAFLASLALENKVAYYPVVTTKLPDPVPSRVIRIPRPKPIKRKPIKEKKVVPPCVQNIKQRAEEGKNLSHEERLILLFWWMNNVTNDVEELVSLFKNVPDFDEKKTRYYVEHALKRGYRPYSCTKIIGLGLCPFNGEKEKCPLFSRTSS